jgi:hypothetical protein
LHMVKAAFGRQAGLASFPPLTAPQRSPFACMRTQRAPTPHPGQSGDSVVEEIEDLDRGSGRARLAVCVSANDQGADTVAQRQLGRVPTGRGEDVEGGMSCKRQAWLQRRPVARGGWVATELPGACVCERSQAPPSCERVTAGARCRLLRTTCRLTTPPPPGRAPLLFSKIPEPPQQSCLTAHLVPNPTTIRWLARGATKGRPETSRAHQWGSASWTGAISQALAPLRHSLIALRPSFK